MESLEGTTKYELRSAMKYVIHLFFVQVIYVQGLRINEYPFPISSTKQS
jgi:hypothetical protein